MMQAAAQSDEEQGSAAAAALHDQHDGDCDAEQAPCSSSSLPPPAPSSSAPPSAPTHISIFLRVRPVARPTSRIVLQPQDGCAEFHMPRDAAAGLVNNSRERYAFAFDGVLPQDAQQDEVFQRVAQPLVMGALDGFNGTVFAYGQTGSGKTFTITGGAERYVDRGIIPRAIACLFKELAGRPDHTYKVCVSYLEVYNEVGYDLLDPSREVAGLEDLPQVAIQEDDEGHIHCRNLSVHAAASEEEALNLLFLGDTNRTISETPMNQASSRSHCIFTLALEARRPGSDVVRASKLHLVDLAGSERVGKTGVDGTTLREAKFINLSLHYLEQVIVALQERSSGLSRAHVPYRNSLMTLVLRDSLGGNCRTAMVATISGDAGQIEESISTCRFAQRVAMVTNEVSVNEAVDPAAIIARLKQQLRDLKEELALLRGGAVPRGPLTDDELQRLRQQLLAYVDGGGSSDGGGSDGGSSGSLNLGGDMMMIRASWQVFRQLVLEGRAAAAQESLPTAGPSGLTASGGSDAGSTSTSSKALQEQVRKLHLQVQQRDNEIALLINMLRDGGGSGSSSSTPAAAASWDTAADTASKGSDTGPIVSSSSCAAPPVLSALLLDASLLSDRHKAFELFRSNYKHGQAIEEHTALLRAKYDEAKALGAAASSSRDAVSQLKSRVELWRAQRAAACVAEGRELISLALEDDPREQAARLAMEQQRGAYKAAVGRLRGLKGEIEHLQLLLEQAKRRLQQDFQQWLALVARQQAGAAPAEPPQQHARSSGSKPGTPSSGQQLRRSMSSLGKGAGAADHHHHQHDQQQAAGELLRELQPAAGRSSRPPSAAGRLARSVSATAAAATPRAPPPAAAAAAAAAGVDLTHVDPALLEAAAPHLTGDPAADADILGFYAARAKLLEMKLGG